MNIKHIALSMVGIIAGVYAYNMYNPSKFGL